MLPVWPWTDPMLLYGNRDSAAAFCLMDHVEGVWRFGAKGSIKEPVYFISKALQCWGFDDQCVITVWSQQGQCVTVHNGNAFMMFANTGTDC